MVFFAEINKTDNEHEVINGCLLQMICNIYKEKEVVFWGAKKHFENLELADHSLISKFFVSIRRPKDGNKLNWILKYFHEIRLIIRLLRHAKKNKANLLFFSSLSVFGNYAIVSITKYFFKKLPIVITMHGEMELLKQDPKRSKTEQIFGKILKKALRKNTNNIWYLLLGSTIKKQAINLEFLKENQILCIEHPYIFPERSRDPSLQSIPTFGHLGIAKKSKNSQLFFALAKRFSQEILDKRVKFKIIGRVWEDLEKEVDSLVEYADTQGSLNRSVYSKRISEIDYAIFLYDNKHYELTGSGAIMDAISFQKPILCLKTEYFANLFSLTGKEPGWIFDDFESLSEKIKDIIDGKEIENYCKQLQNIESLKRFFSLSCIEIQLASELRLIREIL